MKVKKNVFNQDRDCNYALASWLVQSLTRQCSHQFNSLSPSFGHIVAELLTHLSVLIVSKLEHREGNLKNPKQPSGAMRYAEECFGTLRNPGEP